MKIGLLMPFTEDTANPADFCRTAEALGFGHRAYADDVLKCLTWTADVPPNGFVIEIGCNDGDMLRHFAEVGFKTLGVDPALGPVGVAREIGRASCRERV